MWALLWGAAKEKILGLGRVCAIFNTHSERQYNGQSAKQQASAFFLV
jgi:hypothetical protein